MARRARRNHAPALKANLGHENVLTTFTFYGQVDRLR